VIPWRVVSNTVGPSLIVASFAGDLDRAGHRRRRITRRGDECHGVKKIGTVIPHACAGRLANALAAGSLVVAMIELAFGRTTVPHAGRSLRLGARLDPAPHPAELLAAIAGTADAEHELASSTALEAEQLVVVHRPPGAMTRNLLRTSASSIVCSKPASIG
jgi:hypothetical protein